MGPTREYLVLDLLAVLHLITNINYSSTIISLMTFNIIPFQADLEYSNIDTAKNTYALVDAILEIKS